MGCSSRQGNCKVNMTLGNMAFVYYICRLLRPEYHRVDIVRMLEAPIEDVEHVLYRPEYVDKIERLKMWIG